MFEVIIMIMVIFVILIITTLQPKTNKTENDIKKEKTEKIINSVANKYEIETHSWGESIGISRALICIANELAETNKLIREKQKIDNGGCE